jgi:Fe-S-cluster containining protein
MAQPDEYPALLSEIDRWHAEVSERHPGIIPCKPGCAACCHGPFDISVADALLVRDTVAALPSVIREELVRRAEAQLTRMGSSEPGLPASFDISALGEERFDALTERFSEEPCPALDDTSRCVIYAGRPMVCRMMGLGLETGAGDVIENACPIRDNFQPTRRCAQQFDLSTWKPGGVAGRATEVLFGREAGAATKPLWLARSCQHF